MRIANREARFYVRRQQTFTGSHLYAEWLYGTKSPCYVVYSYGEHFPIYVYNGSWYENSARYSVTTLRHRGQCRPTSNTILKTTSEMKAIISQALRPVETAGRLVEVND